MKTMKKQIFCLLLMASILAIGVSAQNADIFQKNNIKTRMLKVADWQLKNPKHDLFDWTNGAFYAGVFAAYETTKSPEIWKA